jgi:polysaccharide deacetylase 2 family uncharacterized protein YibQ
VKRLPGVFLFHRDLHLTSRVFSFRFAYPIVSFLLAAALLSNLAACRRKASDSEENKRATAEREHAPAQQAVGPRLAVIVDDLGYDRAAARQVFSLPYHLTVAVLPNHPDSADIAEEAHRRGFEVLLHLPMESLAGEDKEEKEELRVGEPDAEIGPQLDRMLSTVPHATGVNNHQGSRATANAALMNALAAALHVRGLFFIDSRTSGASVALEAAHRAGVPSAARTIFLDDVEQAGAIRQQLDHAERQAQEQGWSLAIGHPHGVTLQVLAAALPEIEAHGVRLVFASEIARRIPRQH